MIKKSIGSIFSLLLIPATIMIFTLPIVIYFLPLFSNIIVLSVIRLLLILWSCIFLLSLSFLSSYCGFLCPITKLFNVMAKLTNNKSILTHRFPKVVGTITQIFWLSSMIYAIIRFSYGQFSDSKDIYSYPEILILFCLYGISSFLLRTPFGKDELGHYLCPFTTFIKLGIKINILLKIPGYRIIVHKDKCKLCKKCNSICSYQNDVVKMVQQEVINYSVCSNCGKCIDACKFHALERQWTSVKE